MLLFLGMQYNDYYMEDLLATMILSYRWSG